MSGRKSSTGSTKTDKVGEIVMEMQNLYLAPKAKQKVTNKGKAKRVPSAESIGHPPEIPYPRPSLESRREELLASMTLHQIKKRLRESGASHLVKQVEREPSQRGVSKKRRYEELLRSLKGGNMIR
jgi:hypothetical protein